LYGSIVFSHFASDASVELLRIRGVLGRVGRVELREHLGEMVGDHFQGLGIEVVVRIAERVDVALGAIHRARGFLEHVDAFRCVHEPGRALLNLGIPTARQHQRQPAAVELEPDRDEHVGVLNRLHQARLRRDEVRVLVPAAEALGGHVFSADMLRDRGEIGQRRGDLEVRERRRRREDGDQIHAQASDQQLH